MWHSGPPTHPIHSASVLCLSEGMAMVLSVRFNSSVTPFNTYLANTVITCSEVYCTWMHLSEIWGFVHEWVEIGRWKNGFIFQLKWSESVLLVSPEVFQKPTLSRRVLSTVTVFHVCFPPLCSTQNPQGLEVQFEAGGHHLLYCCGFLKGSYAQRKQPDWLIDASELSPTTPLIFDF